MTRNVSCIIRTYNEADFVGVLIKKLNAQATAAGVDLEIVVVDSGSTDPTPQIAKELGAQVIEIPREEFNYSTSLNLGIEKSCGDFVLIVSAHILPIEDNWLAAMLAGFSNENVAGVYCRQAPWPEADWREVVRLEKQFSADPIRFAKGSSLENLCFSNAASCIRRSVWQRHPFVVMPAAEDREWACWAIRNDYIIAYESKASVYHSHQEPPRQAARRHIDIEKATDLRLGRKRTFLFTLKQACGLGLREIRLIFILGCCHNKRVNSCRETLAKAFWYAVDFND
ncbi:MAG: glycosyltransferase family 2 protein [Sedimentisphaerales bacterium]|nr:glycosyltransferase family 2 protein [Sedimentisphaerales bacterium]